MKRMKDDFKYNKITPVSAYAYKGYRLLVEDSKNVSIYKDNEFLDKVNNWEEAISKIMNLERIKK